MNQYEGVRRNRVESEPDSKAESALSGRIGVVHGKANLMRRAYGLDCTCLLAQSVLLCDSWSANIDFEDSTNIGGTFEVHHQILL